jgi:hypothetical protein
MPRERWTSPCQDTQKTASKIQAYNLTYSTLSILAWIQEVWRRCTIPPTNRWNMQTHQHRNKTSIKIVGSILYYARAVDLTVVMSLSTIASEQTKGTEKTLGRHTKSLIIWRHTQMQRSNFVYPEWSWTSIQMLHIWANRVHTAGRVGIFYRQITNRWETYKTQRRISHIVCYNAICCSICGRSRIGSNVSKLLGGDDF